MAISTNKNEIFIAMRKPRRSRNNPLNNAKLIIKDKTNITIAIIVCDMIRLAIPITRRTFDMIAKFLTRF